MSNGWEDLITHLTPHDKEVYKRKIRIANAQNSLEAFTTFTKPNYHVNWHHRLIFKSIDRFLEDPTKRRLMVFVGPRRGKSEIISRRLPAYYLGKFPDNNIIATSYGDSLATKLNREVQRIIDNDLYREVFPDTQLSGSNVKTSSRGSYIRTSDRFEVVGHEGAYRSSGVGGGITGMGFNLGIIDDPLKDAAEAKSPTRKRKIWDWYDTTFSTRAAPGAKTILIMTRWATDDLAGTLIERATANPNAPQWEIICFPEIYDPSHPFIHEEDHRQEGDVLWPAAFNREEVYAKKEETDVKNWTSLYQQLPSPGEGVIFKEQDFKYFKELPELENLVMSVDCAFKETKTSDAVSIGVWGKNGPNKYLIYRRSERMGFTKTIAAMIKVLSMYPEIRKVLVEDKANGPAVIDTLKDKISRLIPFQPKGSKESRANAVAPQIEGGNVYLPDPYYGPNRTAFPWCVKGVDEFVTQVCGFPYMPNDDDVDMMSQYLLNDGKSNKWIDDLVGKGQKTPEATSEQKFTENLADMMGWDLTGESDRYGGIFSSKKKGN